MKNCAVMQMNLQEIQFKREAAESKRIYVDTEQFLKKEFDKIKSTEIELFDLVATENQKQKIHTNNVLNFDKMKMELHFFYSHAKPEQQVLLNDLVVHSNKCIEKCLPKVKLAENNILRTLKKLEDLQELDEEILQKKIEIERKLLNLEGDHFKLKKQM